MLIEDENDCDPVFTRQSYTATVAENNHQGAFIIQVNATDDDAGENARLRFYIDDDVMYLFEINEATGVITAKTSLDFEQLSKVLTTSFLLL